MLKMPLDASGQHYALADELTIALRESETRLSALIEDLISIATISDRMFQATDYQELVIPIVAC